jgi:hypothetical protein
MLDKTPGTSPRRWSCTARGSSPQSTQQSRASRPRRANAVGVRGTCLSRPGMEEDLIQSQPQTGICRRLPRFSRETADLCKGAGQHLWGLALVHCKALSRDVPAPMILPRVRREIPRMVVERFAHVHDPRANLPVTHSQNKERLCTELPLSPAPCSTLSCSPRPRAAPSGSARPRPGPQAC